MKRTRICDLLGTDYAIIQAPMIWITGAALAAAVSNAGGLGTIGFNAGATEVTKDVEVTGERLRGQIRKTKSITDKPFAVNFSVPEHPFSDRCIEVAIEEGIAAAIMVGDSPKSYTKRLQEAGVKVLFRLLHATNVEAAKKAEEAGVDAIIVVGYEGGGHSGLNQLPTLALIPQVVDTVKIPVIAGGGIGDGRGAAAAIALGADGVYIGTAFMATLECDAHPKVKEALVNASDASTTTWTGLFGLSRALENEFTDKVLKMKSEGVSDKEINRFCYGRDQFRPGLIEGNVDEFFLPAGVAAGLIKEVVSAKELVRRIVEDSSSVLAKLS